MFTKPTPPWILVGGAALAGGAGCVNAVGFLGLHHQAVTHMSGTVTNFGMEIARGDRALAWHAFQVLLSFFAGCVLSGLIIRHSALKPGRRYGVALLCESGLLFGATHLFRHRSGSADFLAAMACGLQNAMATSFSGAVIRTTHVTGIITDLGIAVGLLARREAVDWRRVKLYLILLLGFFFGGLAGTLGFLRWSYDVLLVPATLTALVGAGHTALRHFRSPPGAPGAS
ncbi:MAG: hypothetical protein RLZZ15_1832 [Verrucomicrobiota bacterium]